MRLVVSDRFSRIEHGQRREQQSREEWENGLHELVFIYFVNNFL
jgi:hypothetical protein